ncbi:hypothetical protein NMY22_g2279 [Coprinellus aureogranulatus]|nr:hypothetical protein NMY22_g2279 [Coprinellus aureogranulatus]
MARQWKDDLLEFCDYPTLQIVNTIHIATASKLFSECKESNTLPTAVHLILRRIHGAAACPYFVYDDHLSTARFLLSRFIHHLKCLVALQSKATQAVANVVFPIIHTTPTTTLARRRTLSPVPIMARSTNKDPILAQGCLGTLFLFPFSPFSMHHIPATVLGRIIDWATNKSFEGPAREESSDSGSESGYAGDYAYGDDVRVDGGRERGNDWETEDEDGGGHDDDVENGGSLGEEDNEDDWETEDDDDSGPESEPYDHTAPHPHQLSLMHWEYFGLEFLDTPIPPAYHLLWLCGPAGDGKSAVSQAVCEALDGVGLLLASFFFFRGSGTRSKIARFVVTLASQMVGIIPETAPLVAAALKVPSLAGAGVVTQFRRLVLQPLQAVVSLEQGASDQVCAPPFIVVIDGADECDDRDDMAELIEHLLEVFKENPRLPLRILFVSRIEAHIQGRLEDGRVHIENLRCYQALEDITLLVNDTFERARKRDRVIRSYGCRWPSDSQVRSLVNHANGSFIFARTLLDYILGLDSVPHDGLTPMDRLECALNLNGLDAFPGEFCRLVRIRHIPPPGHPDVQDHQHLDPLQSIIYLPATDDTGVSFFHASLADFLHDGRRSGSIISPTEVTLRRDYLSYRALEVICMQKVNVLHILGDPLWRDHIEHLRGTLSDPARRRKTCEFLESLALQIMTRLEAEILLANFFSEPACRRRRPPGYPDRSIEEALDLHLPWLNPDSLFEEAPYEDVSYEEDMRAPWRRPGEKIDRTERLCIYLTELWGRDKRGVASSWVGLEEEMGIQLHGRPFEPRDPAIHRCAVMHSTLGLISLFRHSGPRDMCPGFLKHWIEHLTLAITSTGDDSTDKEELLAFLQSGYLPAEGSASDGEKTLSLSWPNTSPAQEALDALFPGLLGNSHMWEVTPDCSGAYRPSGLTIVDLLKIFEWLSYEPGAGTTVIINTGPACGSTTHYSEIMLRIDREDTVKWPSVLLTIALRKVPMTKYAIPISGNGRHELDAIRARPGIGSEGGGYLQGFLHFLQWWLGETLQFLKWLLKTGETIRTDASELHPKSNESEVVVDDCSPEWEDELELPPRGLNVDVRQGSEE